MVGAAGCVGSVGKGLVGGENVRGAGGGGYFVVGRAGPVAGAADAFKPNHKALQIGGKGSLGPQQQQLDVGRCPRRSGAFGVVVGARGLMASRRKRREKNPLRQLLALNRNDNAPSSRSLASLQQGSTLQLPPYYPVVGGEAENMRYAIYSPKTSPHPKYIHPLCASPVPFIWNTEQARKPELTHLSAAKTVVRRRTAV